MGTGNRVLLVMLRCLLPGVLLAAVLAAAACAGASSTSTSPASRVTTATSLAALSTTTTSLAALSTTTAGASASTTVGSPPSTATGSLRVATPGGDVMLTPAQAAGQRIVYSYAGLTPPPKLLALIRNGEAAGVVFFGENISSVHQIAAVIAQLEEANANPSNPIHAPLLLMADQEGGTVRRLPGEPLLSEKQIGASPDPRAAAESAGTKAGENLAGAGLNLNLAPVLDVYRRSGDFIDRYGRSYSKDPAVVAALASLFISAQQRTGVLATAKHFPGLGAAAAGDNTDLGPVTLNVPLATLRSVDEAPYKAAIAAGVRVVMLSWAVYPSLDPRYPAGLSSKIVQGELRRQFDFQGVTVTDALAAGALESFGTIERRAQLAARAGMDLMLATAVKPQLLTGEEVKDSLAAALALGDLPASDFQEAVRRVVELRFGFAE